MSLAVIICGQSNRGQARCLPRASARVVADVAVSWRASGLRKGIPYPNAQSTELKERMAYLKATSSSASNSGQDAGQVLCKWILRADALSVQGTF